MSTALEAYFAARIYSEGQALRRTTLRHVHLADPPLAIAMWRLGGERFRAAAIAWGPLDGPFQLAVAGEPRNRDLYFAALQPFAADLCARVRRAAASRVARQRGSVTEAIPTDALQIVVPEHSDGVRARPARPLPRLPVRPWRPRSRSCSDGGG